MKMRKSTLFAIILLMDALFFALGMLVATWFNSQESSNTTDTETSVVNTTVVNNENVEEDEEAIDEYLPIDTADIDYIEIATVNSESSDYEDAIKIEDTDIIEELIDEINEFTLYDLCIEEEQEIIDVATEDFGIDGIIEGASYIQIYFTDETSLLVYSVGTLNSTDSTDNATDEETTISDTVISALVISQSTNNTVYIGSEDSDLSTDIYELYENETATDVAN